MAVTTQKRVHSTTLALVRRPGVAGPLLGLDAVAREAGLHPQLVRRFVSLGLVEPAGGTAAAPLFTPQAAADLARAARLRRDLGVGYAGAVLACELLARIEVLERRLDQALNRYERNP
ncbi:MAG: chaperone modulatory protein CbpM [Solirubrobacteraceae bacterium]|jgi:DNA-binding transcriptional MerR regulator|nr:chaperone modulatory protein CbpM [Solirubrobacteraceae bacterium]MEA2187960.1 chaperone modulatory protein CbpM [Solirubrobacteraceae bacterium]